MKTFLKNQNKHVIISGKEHLNFRKNEDILLKCIKYFLSVHQGFNLVDVSVCAGEAITNCEFQPVHPEGTWKQSNSVIIGMKWILKA